MYTIGICDDMPGLCDMLQSQLENGNFTKQLLEIHLYHSALELLNQRPSLDLLFLDIDMPDMSGLDFMRRYGHLMKDTKVVLLTSYSEYAYEGYKVNAFRYIQKPAKDADLQEIFCALARESVLNTSISFPLSSQEAVQIFLKDIIYIESKRNYSHIITTTTTFRCRICLKDILPQLPEAFFCCPHKSYIVNLKHIMHISKKDCRILMSDDNYVDISHRKMNEFLKIYRDFCFR